MLNYKFTVMKKIKLLVTLVALLVIQNVYADGGMSKDMASLRNSLAMSSMMKNKNKTAKDLGKFEEKIAKVLEKHPEDKGYADVTLAEILLHSINENIQDAPRAFNLYRQAAKEIPESDELHALAIYNIGLCFYQKRAGLTQNFDSAYVYMEKAAELNPKHKMGIGEMTELGLGVNKDPMFALACYEEANKSGGDAYMAAYDLRYALENMQEGTLNQDAYAKYTTYKFKRAVDKDYEGAMAALRESAEMGFLPAIANLGTELCTDGNAKTTEEGLTMLKKAADAGNVPAKHNYAVYYYNWKVWGKAGGVFAAKKTYTDMFSYYMDAATQGFAPSQYAIGNYYTAGVGIEKSNERAYVWYGSSVRQGYFTKDLVGKTPKEHFEACGKNIPEEKKKQLDDEIAKMLTSQALSVKTLNAFSKIPMFEGSKSSTSAEVAQQTAKPFAGNSALNAAFYQSQYNKYGRKVQSEVKSEFPNADYVKALQTAMRSIAAQAEEKGFKIEHNEWENYNI